MVITVPEPSLILLVGPSGSGKSTFAARHFRSTEVVSSDRCRGLITDDETEWSVNQDAFDIVFLITRKRLAFRRLTVIDATNLRPVDRRKFIDIAAEFDVPALAVVFDLAPELCHARNQGKADRNFPFEVAERHSNLLRQFLPEIAQEGFSSITFLSSEAEIDAVAFARIPLEVDSKLGE